MKKCSLFLFLVLFTQSSLALNPFKYFNSNSDDSNISAMVEIEEMNIVGPHRRELLTAILSLKKGKIPASNIFLLYGPTGSGKTTYAEELARIANCNLTIVHGSKIRNKWVGDGGKKIEDMFLQACKGGEINPNYDENKLSILFIDEVDAFANHDGSKNDDGSLTGREDYNISSSLFEQLDKVRKNRNILVIMATNNKSSMPRQVLDRATTKIEVPFPNKRKRKFLFKLYLNNYPELHKHIREFAKVSGLLSARNIENICNEVIEFSKIENKKLSKKMILHKINTETIEVKEAWQKSLQFSSENRKVLDDYNRASTAVSNTLEITKKLLEILSKKIY